MLDVYDQTNRLTSNLPSPEDQDGQDGQDGRDGQDGTVSVILRATAMTSVLRGDEQCRIMQFQVLTPGQQIDVRSV